MAESGVELYRPSNWLTPLRLGLVRECVRCRGYGTVGCWCWCRCDRWVIEIIEDQEPLWFCVACYAEMRHTDECRGEVGPA